MKRKILLCAFAGVMLIQISACKKCVDCSYPGSSTSQRICKPSWDDQKAWQQQLDYYTQNGGSCR